MSIERPRRARRSTADVRARILQAARELFLDQGFQATTTKQICERADVSEPLLFTNFGTKITCSRARC
jgi:AcrR family transcriptional regulator